MHCLLEFSFLPAPLQHTATASQGCSLDCHPYSLQPMPHDADAGGLTKPQPQLRPPLYCNENHMHGSRLSSSTRIPHAHESRLSWVLMGHTCTAHSPPMAPCCRPDDIYSMGRRQCRLSLLTKLSISSPIQSLTTNNLLSLGQEMFGNLDLKQLPPHTALMCASHTFSVL